MGLIDAGSNPLRLAGAGRPGVGADHCWAGCSGGTGGTLAGGGGGIGGCGPEPSGGSGGTEVIGYSLSLITFGNWVIRDKLVLSARR
jgi:hypothetical protein